MQRQRTWSRPVPSLFGISAFSCKSRLLCGKKLVRFAFCPFLETRQRNDCCDSVRNILGSCLAKEWYIKWRSTFGGKACIGCVLYPPCRQIWRAKFQSPTDTLHTASVDGHLYFLLLVCTISSESNASIDLCVRPIFLRAEVKGMCRNKEDAASPEAGQCGRIEHSVGRRQRRRTSSSNNRKERKRERLVQYLEIETDEWRDPQFDSLSVCCLYI